MISFKNSTSLVDIEDAHAVLSTVDDSEVRLPTSLKHGGGVGITPALIQFVAKLSRLHSGATINLHSASLTEDGLRTLAQEPHGMCALYFVPSIAMSSGARESTKTVLEQSVPRIQAMQAGHFRETMHGRGAFLSCFSGAKNEFLLPFYSRGQKDSLRGREEFSKLTEQLIDACAPNAIRHLPARHMKAVSNLVYELFRNTDEHAQTDEEGNSYRRNVRGILAKFISYSGDSLSADSLGQDAAQNFFMLRTLTNQKRRIDAEGHSRASSDVTFLELTVFDTGPGLVRRWLSKHKPGLSLDDVSVEEEVEFVKRCFEQHATTKDSEESGHGLDLVVTSLDELSGFLRLRTGRICLIQDFSSSSSSTFAPRHWLKERPLLSAVPGAAYSIVIPLSRGKS